MSSVANQNRLTVPQSLERQLHDFRRFVWRTQMLSAIAFALVGLLLAYLAVYCLDRVFDTPRSLRSVALAITIAASFAVPWAFYRWVYRHRRMDQLARLLRERDSSIGDQLLSVIELAENDHEQARSRTLCAAAFSQVAHAAEGRDFKQAAPESRARTWSILTFAATAVVAILTLVTPDAASNAWARLTSPWSATPRYTFTAVEVLPSQIVVPHGESGTLLVRLQDHSKWQPENATLDIAGLPTITSARDANQYNIELPPQTESIYASLKVGDYLQRIEFIPKFRPELVSATAEIQLPAYLELKESVTSDVRSGTLMAVAGSSATIHATASRTLESAKINNSPARVSDATIRSAAITVDERSGKLELAWRDHDGLDGREPFELTIQALEDEEPSITSQQLPRQSVILDSEQLNFSAMAADDFGVKRIGMQWKGIDERGTTPIAQGEKVLAGGGPDQSSLQVPAMFSAAALGIQPQPIELRLWVEDFLPGRERVLSAPHVFFVLSPEEHAIWVSEQLSKWHRASLEVRDREIALHKANQRLREMSSQELGDEEFRKELQSQAAAEANNGRRLTRLSGIGEQLLRQAARNPEIGVGHLDRWAEMLQILNDISVNRMPSVADLLAKASSESRSADSSKSPTPSKKTNAIDSLADGSSQKSAAAQEGKPKETGPSAGKQRSSGGASNEPPPQLVGPKQPKMPSLNDSESSMQPSEPSDSDDGEPGKPKKKFNGSKLSLPSTTLAGPAGKKQDEDPQSPEPEDDGTALSKALFEQEELLAEFERLSDEMNKLLANMEGSTLVKRLKAAAREQTQVAERISTKISNLFGKSSTTLEEDKALLANLSEVEEKGSQKVSFIMDDMQSYFERRRMNQFKLVLDEMKENDVVSSIRKVGEEIPLEQGMSIAQAEYWADTLDRWAEDLVDPASSGTCPGSKDSDALPPSLILEALQILEGEVNLREATRVADRAKDAIPAEERTAETSRLGTTQDELRSRTDKVVTKIRELPEGAQRFRKEIDLLSQVSSVMTDATSILRRPDTGSPAIAAETEAIELLLQCKRINPKGGGGGGTSPGGGGTGTTQDSALALLGSGLNQNEKRELREVNQATGETGRVLPEEFRAGLDQYFNRLESSK